MASQPQTIVQPAAPVDKPLGSRNQANLNAIFPSSPINSGKDPTPGKISLEIFFILYSLVKLYVFAQDTLLLVIIFAK